jgi:hypothetical protein
MTSQNKVVAATVAGVAVIAVIVLGVSLHWPAAVTILVVLVVGAVAALAYLGGTRRRPGPHQQHVLVSSTPVVEPPPAVNILSVQGVNLASAWADYEFTFDATVYWRSVGGPSATSHLRPGALAVDTIIRRAAQVAASEPPTMHIRLQHRLLDALGVVDGDPAGRIEAWADQVRTTVSPADLERLQMMADLRKNKAVWELRRGEECDKREYLTQDVLKSTGSALVWWLSRNESNVTGAVDLIGTMARLSAAAKNEDVPDLFRHLLPSDALPDPNRFTTLGSDGAGQPFGFDFAPFNGSRSAVDLVTALMGALNLDDEQRAMFAAQVANDIESTGDEATAEEVRRRFDVMTEDPEPAPPPPDDMPATEAMWPVTPDD